MADDKQTKLSIVINTVDQATAKIKAINDRLDASTKPIRNLKDALGDLRSKSGLDDVLNGFKGVGSAVAGLLSQVAMIGGVVGLAVAGVFHLVKEFDDLGDKAERFGVSVDFLAQMRYAAEKAGAPLGALDEGMVAFSQSRGQARAGSGRMLKFLNLVSVPLAQQVVAAKSNEAAFDLLADAMAKITDPAKKAALAQKTLGDAALAPLFGKGAKGVKELRDRYLKLAGSMEGAADQGGKVDDAMHDMKAATDGVKAALMRGLGPALMQIVQELQAFFTENRERIGEWAMDFGKKLPGAIHAFVDGFLNAIDSIQRFVEKIGGIKTVAVAVVAFMVGPLVSAFATLGVALLTTPVGQFVVALGLLAAAAGLIVENWDDISEFFGDIWDGITGAFEAAWAKIKPIVDAIRDSINWVKEHLDGLIGDDFGGVVTMVKKQQEDATGVKGGGDLSGVDLAVARFRNQQTQQALAPNGVQAALKVEFVNTPKNARVTTDPTSTANVDLNVGFQMWGMP